MSQKIPGDYRRGVKVAKKQGWTLTQTGKMHNRLVPPEGALARDGSQAQPITFPRSPRGSRGMKDFICDLRRQGVTDI